MKKEFLPILEEFRDDVEKLCEEIEMLRDQKKDMLFTIEELQNEIEELKLADRETESDGVRDAIEDRK